MNCLSRHARSIALILSILLWSSDHFAINPPKLSSNNKLSSSDNLTKNDSEPKGGDSSNTGPAPTNDQGKLPGSNLNPTASKDSIKQILSPFLTDLAQDLPEYAEDLRARFEAAKWYIQEDEAFKNTCQGFNKRVPSEYVISACVTGDKIWVKKSFIESNSNDSNANSSQRSKIPVLVHELNRLIVTEELSYTKDNTDAQDRKVNVVDGAFEAYIKMKYSTTPSPASTATAAHELKTTLNDEFAVKYRTMNEIYELVDSKFFRFVSLVCDRKWPTDEEIKNVKVENPYLKEWDNKKKSSSYTPTKRGKSTRKYRVNVEKSTLVQSLVLSTAASQFCIEITKKRFLLPIEQDFKKEVCLSDWSKKSSVNTVDYWGTTNWNTTHAYKEVFESHCTWLRQQERLAKHRKPDKPVAPTDDADNNKKLK